MCVYSMTALCVCMRGWLYAYMCVCYIVCVHTACTHRHLHTLSCNTACSCVSQRLACDAHGMPRVCPLCLKCWQSPHTPPCQHIAVEIGHGRQPRTHKRHMWHKLWPHRYGGFRNRECVCQCVRYTCVCCCVRTCVCSRANVCIRVLLRMGVGMCAAMYECVPMHNITYASMQICTRPIMPACMYGCAS